MTIVNDVLKDLNDYVNRLQEENRFLQRGYDELKRENERLKDNEKEMLKVSSIITTSNENTKLKVYINILEEQLKKYKSNPNVVFEIHDPDPEQEENIKTLKQVDEQLPEQEENTFTSETPKDNTIATSTGIEENCLDSLNTKIDTDLRVFKYKNETYFIDKNNVLYENIDNVKGKEVGKRKLNTKTNKFKTILCQV